MMWTLDANLEILSVAALMVAEIMTILLQFRKKTNLFYKKCFATSWSTTCEDM